MAKGATHEKRVRQNKHSEVVTVAPVNAATTNLPGLAINRQRKFYAQIFARWCWRPSGAQKTRSMVTGTTSSSMCLDPRILLGHSAGLFTTALVKRNHKGVARGRDAATSQAS